MSETLQGFSVVLSRVRADAPRVMAEFIAIAAADLLADVRNRHGRYPSDVSWAALKPSTVARKGKDTPLLQTASLRNAVQAEFGEKKSTVYTDHSLALIHEFGANGRRTHIPARPIWSPAVRKMESEIDPKMDGFVAKASVKW